MKSVEMKMKKKMKWKTVTWPTINNQVVPACETKTNIRPNKGVVCSSQIHHNLWYIEIQAVNTLIHTDLNVAEPIRQPN